MWKGHEEKTTQDEFHNEDLVESMKTNQVLDVVVLFVNSLIRQVDLQRLSAYNATF